MLFRNFLSLIVLTTVSSFFLSCPAEERTFFSGAKPRNFAHRGGAQVAPENTLYAYRRALEVGTDIIELDVRSTKDNHIVVLHDQSVDRTTNGTGHVKELTLAELKKLDAAYRFSPDRGTTFPLRGKGLAVPTLEEVFEFCRDYVSSKHKTEAQRENAKRIRFNLETKARGFEKQLIDIVKKFDLQDRVTVQSFDHGSIVVVSEIDPGICTAALNGVPSRIVQETKAAIWSHNHAGVSSAKVKAAHDLGLLVIPWTVNDAARMNTLIDWGVDGIITDYPDVLKDILNERGIPYAPPLN